MAQPPTFPPAHAWLQMKNGRRVPIQGTVTIGRSSQCTVPLPESTVSRKHASIELWGDAIFRLTDLGSTHGTKLNGALIASPTLLHNGDRIEVGPYVFTFMKTFGEAPPVELSEDDPEATMPQGGTKLCWLVGVEPAGVANPLAGQPADSKILLMGGWFNRIHQSVERNGGILSRVVESRMLAHWVGQGESTDEQVLHCLREFLTLQSLQKPRFLVVAHYGEACFSAGPERARLTPEGPEVMFAFEMFEASAHFKNDFVLSQSAEQRLVRHCSLLKLGEHTVPVGGTPQHFYSLAAG